MKVQTLGLTCSAFMLLSLGCGKNPQDTPKSEKQGPEERASAPKGPKDASASRQRKKSGTATGRPSTATAATDPNFLEWNQRLTALRKIKAGMTIEQVEGIIGVADENTIDDDRTGILAKRGITLSILTWRGDDPSPNGDFIMIGFENEKLKETSQIKVHASKN